MPSICPWPHFMKPCSSQQYQTSPFPALTAIVPAFLWLQVKKSSSSSCRPSCSSHIFLVPLPWKPSGKVFLCRWLSFFFLLQVSLRPTYIWLSFPWGLKNVLVHVTCHVAKPKGQFSASSLPLSSMTTLCPKHCLSWFAESVCCSFSSPSVSSLLTLCYLTAGWQFPRASS